MAHNDQPAQTTDPTAKVAYPRLPCRGCLPDCSNYASCHGHPWRETATESPKPVEQ